MAQLILTKDPLPALIAALRSECAKVVGAPVKVSSILAKDPGAGNTIHVYVAGGYPKTMVSSAATVLMHCYAKDGPAAQRLAAAAAAVVALDRQEWHSGACRAVPMTTRTRTTRTYTATRFRRRSPRSQNAST